ncbi:ParB N-terminal domain-containing protein [Pasteurella multocida]|uniref:ParB N-terminal domain-containing protein n=1 Tax=Pasteurella multocida TaxID=747 RepID=UPI00397E7073
MQKTISINRLYLDTKNPRHLPINEQKKIIESLIENEKIKDLAKDISEKGLTNPLDYVGITVEDGKRIVLEGNRRVCALKLLLNPELAPKKHQKYFYKLKEKLNQPITKINVYQFNSREEASPWLATLHTASSKSARKSWSPEQQTRFEQSANGRPDHAAALTVLEFSLENDIIEPEQSQKVITTITRMLSSPEVREAFGILTGVRERNIQINIQHDEFKNILIQYFKDVDSSEHNIGSRSNKTDRLEYIKHLKKIGKIPSTRLSNGVSLISGIPSTINPKLQQKSSSALSQTKTTKSRPQVKNNEFIIDYELSIPVSKIDSIYQELRTKLKVTETPYAVAALLRAIVEQSCDYFLISHGNLQFHDNGGKSEKIKEDSNLRAKILGISQYLEKQGHLESKELATLINECQPKKDGIGTLNLLNGVLHNYAHNITSEHIIAAHDNLKPFIISIWQKYRWPSEI